MSEHTYKPWTEKFVQKMIETGGFKAVAESRNDSVEAACKAQADETKRCIEMVGGLGNQHEVPIATIMENEAKAAAGMARLRERNK